MKIAILVEGETEMAFRESLLNFLKLHLKQRMPKLKFIPQKGRLPKEEKLKRVVEKLSSGKDAYDAVIALTDVYTGTDDFQDAADAKKQMKKWVGNHPKFFPHVAQYDFEAWLLPFWPSIQELAKHNKSAPSGAPEEVNHNNPPSRRIREIFESGKRRSYSKPRDGASILRKNDLMKAIQVCPELKAFINTILSLSEGELIP